MLLPFYLILYAVVVLASCDLSSEFFGRRFNQNPVAIIDISEPSNTGKEIREFFGDMQRMAVRGIWLIDYKGGGAKWLHKPFLKGHLENAFVR